MDISSTHQCYYSAWFWSTFWGTEQDETYCFFSHTHTHTNTQCSFSHPSFHFVSFSLILTAHCHLLFLRYTSCCASSSYRCCYVPLPWHDCPSVSRFCFLSFFLSCSFTAIFLYLLMFVAWKCENEDFHSSFLLLSFPSQSPHCTF